MIGLVSILSCKTKKELTDPTVLQVNVLAVVEKGVQANKIQSELSDYFISDIKPTNKTLNEYLYKVTLKGQTANDLLKAFNEKSYIKSAIIAPTGDGPAQNMPSGKSTRTSPVKG